MPAATSNCLSSSCKTRVEGTVTTCPNCGGKMRTPRSVRISGWLLLACGVFLAGFMSYIANSLAPSMLHPGATTGGTTFTGNAEQARTIFTMFGAIIAFGLAGIGYGLFMIVTGRRSLVLMFGVLGLAVVLLALVWRTMLVLPG
jgi:hypothetical protein